MGEKKLNDNHLQTFKGLAVGARLRPFLASIVLHAGLLMALFAGGPLFGPAWEQLDVASGSLEVMLLSSPSQVSSVRDVVRPAREVKPVSTKPTVAALADDVAIGEKVPDSELVPSQAVVSVSTSTAAGIAGAVAGASGVNSPEALYLAEIRTLLDSKKEYPIAARRMGHRGRVVVRFVLERDGRVQKAEIVQGSSSEILNRAARGLIEGLRSVKPFPKEVALSEWAVVVPIEYQM